MIKINLVPADELENPLWFVPDISIFLIVALITYFGFTSAITSIQDQITSAEEKKGEITSKRNNIANDVKEYNLLNRRIKKLHMQLSALDQITASHFRFMPIIVLEHLQNLKPQGLWFKTLKIGDDKSENVVNVSGNAFDYLLVAEFLTNLRATEEQKIDHLDLRSQIYFSNSILRKAKMPDSERSGDPQYPDVKGIHEFDIGLTVNQRDTVQARTGDISAAWSIDMERFANNGVGPLRNAF